MNAHVNLIGGRTALAALFMLISAPVLSGDAAAPASTGKTGAASKSSPVKLETVAGSPNKRITLTSKAAERLGIQTGVVGEEVVVRKQIVSGMIVYPQAGAARPAANTSGGFGAATTFSAPIKVVATSASPVPTPFANAVVVSGPQTAAPATTASEVIVTLSPGEYARIAKDKPVRVTPLYTRAASTSDMLATLSDDPPVEDAKRSMLTLHYVLPKSDHGLPASTRVRVELQLSGSQDKQKVVPYNAVYYDAKGAAWVYVNTQPLAYERHAIKVQRIVGDRAVLADGPDIGTPVVTVGAALLYGTEIYGK